MKKHILLFVIFFGCFATTAQTEKTKLNIFTFSEVEKLHQQKPKPIVVFIYTDWCKICHGMKRNAFKNNEIIDLLNNQFYFVKLNAEQKEGITFLGKTFVYKPSGNKTGINELAIELASIDEKISYPTTIILNSKLEIDFQIDNYINSKKMKAILKRFLRLGNI
jgi:thioredoxin-related protein